VKVGLVVSDAKKRLHAHEIDAAVAERRADLSHSFIILPVAMLLRHALPARVLAVGMVIAYEGGVVAADEHDVLGGKQRALIDDS